MNKDKNELLYFIIYFIFVMIFPALCIPLFTKYFIYHPASAWDWLVIFIAMILSLGAALKFQFLMILIPILVIRKKSQNPLLLKLLTDIKLNNKIIKAGIFYDVFISFIIYFTNISYNIDIYIWAYWVYFSFTINYLIIYLFAFIHTKYFQQ